MKFDIVLEELNDESYTTTLYVGDKVLIGKYRNKAAEIKGFTYDKHNQPVMKTTKGDRKIHAFRIDRDMPDESSQEKYRKFLKRKLKEFEKPSVKKLSNDEKRQLSADWKKEKEEEDEQRDRQD